MFIQYFLCRQNKGRLGARKRAEYFELLTDEEVALMETVVREVFSLGD